MGRILNFDTYCQLDHSSDSNDHPEQGLEANALLWQCCSLCHLLLVSVLTEHKTTV